MRPIPIEENGEPLVDFSAPPYGLPLHRMLLQYTRELYGRRGLAERLALAHDRLKSQGYGLLITECWRPPHIQRRMFEASEARFREKMPHLSPEELRLIVEQFTAPPDADVPPPHSTGGAVDLWLSGPNGMPADMNAPLDWMDHLCFAFDAPGLDHEARANRDCMAQALFDAGLTNYPSEYWHWSYGDQGWAYRGGHPHAIYGRIVPDNWTPNPEDDIDGPLVFVPDDPSEGA